MSVSNLDVKFIETLVRKFGLNHEENCVLKECVESYLKPHIGTNILNISKAIFGQSPWERAKNVLMSHAPQVLNQQFSTSESNQALAGRSQALSEFALRLLMKRAGGEGFLDPKMCETENLTDISVDEIIERAACGDGTTFPMLTSPILVRQLHRERNDYMAQVERCEHFLATDPSIQSLRSSNELTALYLQHAICKEGLSGLGMPDTLNLLETAVRSARRVCQSISGIDSPNVTSRYTQQDFSIRLRKFRENHAAFVEMVSAAFPGALI